MSGRQLLFNLVDTPGHEDFSEDTYRTLTAVDAAVMVIDGAKGVESQTRKLFEVCRLRDMPILTFCNKMDRESRDTFEIIDEIQENLAIDVTPASWPIGMGKEFLGAYDLLRDRLQLLDRADRNVATEGEQMQGLDDPRLAERLPRSGWRRCAKRWRWRAACCPEFDPVSLLTKATMTPIWFGSALNSFGVLELLERPRRLRPAAARPPAEAAHGRPWSEDKVSGFVFKVQANMDPKHRDRVAFVRLCSGHFKRGMKLKHVRSASRWRSPTRCCSWRQERETAEDAWGGDIMGVPNHGQLRIGDALTEGEDLRFTGIPSFAPELLQNVRATDPMKAKHLDKALTQFAEEGAAKLFKPNIGSGWIVGVVGPLQFDVLASRIEVEYGIPVRFEPTQYTSARWVLGEREAVEQIRQRQEGTDGRSIMTATRCI